MSGKKTKLIKRNVRKSTTILFADMAANIIRMPFKARAKLAWLIFWGVKKGKRKDDGGVV